MVWLYNRLAIYIAVTYRPFGKKNTLKFVFQTPEQNFRVLGAEINEPKKKLSVFTSNGCQAFACIFHVIKVDPYLKV